MIDFLVLSGFVFAFLVLIQTKFSKPIKISGIDEYFETLSRTDIDSKVKKETVSNASENAKNISDVVEDSKCNSRPIPRSVDREIGRISELIVQDFISFWYIPSVSTDPEFPDLVSRTLKKVLNKLADRLLLIHLPLFLLRRVSDAIRHHMRWYAELSETSRKKYAQEGKDYDVLKQEEKNRLFLREFCKAGHLHPSTSLDGSGIETTTYIRAISDELVSRLLDKDELNCELFRCLMREIVTSNILVPSLTSLTSSTISTGIMQALESLKSEEEIANSPDPKDTTPLDVEEKCTNESSIEDSKGSDTDSIWKYYSSDIDREGAEHMLERLSPGSFILWGRSENSVHVSYVDSNNDVKLSSIIFSEKCTIDQTLKRIDPPLKLGVCTTGHRLEKNRSFMVKLSTVPWLKTDGDKARDFKKDINKDSDSRDLSTTAFKESKTAISLEKSNKYLCDVQSAVNSCMNEAIDNNSRSCKIISPDHPFVQELIVSIEQILGYELKEQSDREIMDKSVEPFWRFLRSANVLLGVDSPTKGKNGSDANSPPLASLPVKTFRKSRRMVRMTRKRNSSSGCTPGRAWILSSIANGTIDLRLKELCSHENIIKKYYTEYAIMRDNYKRTNLVLILEQLKTLRIDYNLSRKAGKSRVQKAKKMNRKYISADGTRKKRRGMMNKMMKRGRHIACDYGQNRNAFIPRIGPIRATIVGTIVRHGPESSKYVEYTISCALTNQSDRTINEWKVHRRFSKFYLLHQELKKRYPRFDNVKLPKRQFKIFGNFDTGFIENRRKELEKYLDNVCQHPALSDSEELLWFLSSDLETDTDDGCDDEEAASESDTVYSEEEDKEDDDEEEEADESLDEAVKFKKGELSMAEIDFSKLVMEIFNYNEMGWIKRNLISLVRSVLRFSMNGRVANWIEGTYTRKKSAEQLTQVLSGLREMFWPGGVFMTFEEKPEEGEEDLDEMRQQVFDSLQTSLPGSLRSFLGNEQCNTGCEKVAGFLQNPVCVSNLVFSVLDLLLLQVYEDFPIKEIHKECSFKRQHQNSL